ncbi:MAG: HD domain-containing protein [Planctomycetes bacterium]|nr:HD domain-containing protein [Planctomycetota bacterium]
MKAALKVIKGKGAGVTYPLVQGRRLTCGNGEGCDLLLGEVGVSRKHFAVEFDGRTATLIDLGSTNGTYVNGQKVSTTPLLQDDMVVVGQLVMQFGFTREEPTAVSHESIRFVDDPWRKKEGDILKKLQKTEKLFIDSIIEVYAGEKMERMNRALSILYRVGNILSAGGDLDPMLEQVMKEICDAFRPDAGVVLLGREGTDELESKVVWVKDGRRPSSGIPLSRTVIDKTVKGGLAILANDPQSDERFSTSKSICDYQIKSVICVPLEAQQQVLGALYLDYASGSKTAFQEGDLDLLGAIAKEVGLAIERIRLTDQIKHLSLNAVRALVAAIDAKDPYTSGHSERVAAVSVLLTKELEWSETDVELIHMSGILHDVGKIGIPESIIQKPARLTPQEFETMKRHPVISEKILREFAKNESVLGGIKYHHERLDGKGYPDGLTGERIPRMAKVIAVADAWDAMVTRRAYRGAMPHEQAMAEVVRCRGVQFEAEVCDALARLYQRGALGSLYAAVPEIDYPHEVPPPPAPDPSAAPTPGTNPSAIFTSTQPITLPPPSAVLPDAAGEEPKTEGAATANLSILNANGGSSSGSTTRKDQTS